MIDAMSQCVLDGVGSMNLRRLDKLNIFPVRALQDMLYDGVPVLRMAYTDAEAIECLAPKAGNKGLDPIMPACRSLLRMRVFPGGRSRSSQMMKISSRSTL